MSQQEIILEHLKAGKRITQMEATKKYGILRLAPIIHKLRKQGHRVKNDDMIAKKSGNSYAEYYMSEDDVSSQEPSLFEAPAEAVEQGSSKNQSYDRVDVSETALRQEMPPEIGGTELRSHHVGNPDDHKQILVSFRAYCEQTHGKKINITPDWSRLLLKLNRDLPSDSTDDLMRNRPVWDAKLAEFKQDLRNGTFLYTNIGIGFDEDGWLCDGQTRLTASMQTGVSFVADVSFDIPRDAFAVIDSPRSARKNKDFAYMFGVSEYTAVTVSTVSILYRKHHGLVHTQKLNGKQVIEALKQFDDVGPSVRVAHRMKVVPGPKAIMAAVHYLALKVNKAVAEKAFEDLAIGAIANANDPVLVARNRLIKAYNSKGNEFRGAGDKRVRVMLSRMFNYRCAGKEITYYSLNDGDDWPGDPVRKSADSGKKQTDSDK